jgi:hypothetical protein
VEALEMRVGTTLLGISRQSYNIVGMKLSDLALKKKIISIRVCILIYLFQWAVDIYPAQDPLVGW